MKLADLQQSKTYRLYHGSSTAINAFEPDRINPQGFGHGMGFHFVNDYELAVQYADGGVVIVADITVSNPMIPGMEGSGRGVNRQRVIDMGFDSYMFADEDGYIELVIFDTDQISIVENKKQ